MLKLYIYGYMNRIRSSRKLMTECHRNIELFYLLGKLSPDFRTISDFRKDNPKALREVFRSFVRLCDRLSLYGKELIAIDGTKFRAVNSRDNAYNDEILHKELERIDAHISEYLALFDKADAEEKNESSSLSSEQITQIIAELSERKEKYQSFLKELADTGKTQILTTDPEARRMYTKDGFNCCYNVQTAVDSASHLISEYEATNHNTNQGLEEDRLSKDPEIICKCLAAGILPACYEDFCIRLEVQELGQMSCFSKNDDGTVTCPMGNIMKRTRQRGTKSIYGNLDACRQCTNRCTPSKNPKDVCFSDGTPYIPVHMYGKTNRKLNSIPEGIPLNPNNHNLDHKILRKYH